MRLGCFLLVLMAAMSCDESPCPAPATTRPVIKWDFSKSHRISQVPWPEGKRDSLYVHRQVEGPIQIKFPGRRVVERYVHLVTFSRKRGADDLIAITLSFENQTVDDAFETALYLAREFDLDQKPLREWHKKTIAGEFERVATMRNDRNPRVALEMFRSFDPSRPYAINLEVGWAKTE